MESESITQNWSRKKKFLVQLSLFLVSVIIGLTATEICLRILGYSFPTFYSVDEFRGYALTPNIEGWYRKEGVTYVRINSQGLRDVEHSKEKPSNVLRIALIGDSYSEALQVPLENTFWKIAENQLKQCQMPDGRRVEFINFGVSGYGTAQELITLQKQVWDYSPDVVLLAFTTNNDVTDNSRTLKKANDIPYYKIRNDELELDDSFRGNFSFRWQQSFLSKIGTTLRDNLRFIQLGHHSLYSLKNYSAKRPAKNPNPQNFLQVKADSNSNKSTLEKQAEEVGIDNLIYREPPDEVWQTAWSVTEKLLLQMRNEVESKGAKFLIITLSNGIQVFPLPEVRQNFMKRVGATDLFYPDNRIKSFGESNKIKVYNLAQELQTYAEQNKVFLHGFGENIAKGHWNIEGHRIAGEKLSLKLCENLFK